MSDDTPQRWSELPPGGDDPASRAAALARAARAAPVPLSNDALAALEARIAAPSPRTGAWWKPAGVAALGALVLASLLLLLRQAEAPPPPRAPPPVVARQPEPPVDAEPPEAEPEPAPVPSKVSARPRAPQKVAAAPKAAAATEEESSLLVETRLLRAALEELRQRRDAAAAERALDMYFSRFPDGALKNEALVARVEVFQAQGRKGDALATLDELHRAAFANVPRALELRVLRAELLSARDRCPEAVPAFEQCLNESAQRSPLEERALVGRASCRGRLGDSAGSRADLERYLEWYPDGRFAAQARAAIGK